jgi:hypothetical protein
VRTAEHTYAVGPDGNGWLYHNNADPYQLDNRFAAPGDAPLRERLHALTVRAFEAAGDPFFTAPRP